MKIYENKSFMFSFPFIGMSEMTCHVPAQTREEAGSILKKWFRETLTDLAMEFPEVEVAKSSYPSSAVIQTDFLPGQREILGSAIKELSKYLLPENSFQETVKKFSGFDAFPENYDSIMGVFTEKLKIFEAGVKKVDDTISGGEVISVQETKKKK
jgi:hypothetical protein